MDNLRRIKRVVVWLSALFVLNLVLTAFMLPGWNLWTISAVLVQLVLGVYFAGIILMLLREMRQGGDREKKLKDDLAAARAELAEERAAGSAANPRTDD